MHKRKSQRRFKVTVTVVKEVTRTVKARSERQAEKIAKDLVREKPIRISGKDIEKFPIILELP